MRPRPLSPAIRRRQLVATPIPSGETMPRPVTTTRLISLLSCWGGKPGYQTLGGRFFLVDIIDGVFDGDDLFRRVVGNFNTELFFEGHHELDRVETVGAQIVDETR